MVFSWLLEKIKPSWFVFLCIRGYTTEHAYYVIKMTNYLLGHQVSRDTLVASYRGCAL